VAYKLAALAIGHPIVVPEPIQVSDTTLEEYIGVYKINEKEERTITRQDAQLFSQRSGGMRIEIAPISADTFLVKGSSDRFIFERGENGKVNGMKVLRRLGPPEQCPLTDKPLPVERATVSLAPDQIARFLGTFELAPGFILEITFADDQIFGQASGQPKIKLFPASAEKLFAREVDLSINYEFDGQGNLLTCVLAQGPQSFPLKKIG
jgi:hypothetical protein